MFCDTINTANILSVEISFGGTPGARTNYMLNLNKFLTTRPILDLKVSLYEAET